MKIPRLLLAICVCASMGAADAPRVLSWEACMAMVRSSQASPFAVYMGSRENRLAKAMAAGSVPLAGLPVAFVGARDRVLNPMANRPMPGADLQRLFGATAGTIIFFNDQGLPIYEVSVPQVVHGGDTELVALYCAYVAGRHYSTMTIPEYARAVGKEQIVIRAVERTGGRMTGREVPKGGSLVNGVNVVSGQPIDPWKEAGVFYIYTADPGGRVFLAQVREIWGAFRALNPHITVITPKDTAPKPEDLPEGFQGVLGQASMSEILRQGPSPHLVLVAGDGTQQRALVLGGFQPADAMAAIMRMPVDRSAVNRDIPFSETDDIAPRRDALVDAPAEAPAPPPTLIGP